MSTTSRERDGNEVSNMEPVEEVVAHDDERGLQVTFRGRLVGAWLSPDMHISVYRIRGGRIAVVADVDGVRAFAEYDTLGAYARDWMDVPFLLAEPELEAVGCPGYDPELDAPLPIRTSDQPDV